MTLDQFVILQEELWRSFGWIARWWLITFAVAGIALSAFMFFLSVVSTWIDSK